MYSNVIKRMMGFLFALLGLFVLLIPMLIITVAIKIDSKGAVIFKQERLGKNKKHFIIYKFRTMIPDAFAMGGTSTYDGDPRITKVGALLRKTSLDELPQLINIIRGDMAIIGPRPILPFEFDKYKGNEFFEKRFTILPGLFCSVDLNYRAIASRELQFEMDAEYSEKMSFWLDVKLIFGVIKTVIKGANVYKEKKELIKDTSKTEKSNDVKESISTFKNEL